MNSLIPKDNKKNLELIARNIISIYELAEMIRSSHVFGYPGTLPRNIYAFVKRNIASLKSLSDHISSDGDTYLLISEILGTTQRILENDKDMKLWVENFTGQSINKIRKTSKLSIQKQNEEGEFLGETSFPGWTADDKYKAFVEETLGLMKTLVNLMKSFFDNAINIDNAFVRNWYEEENRKGRFDI